MRHQEPESGCFTSAQAAAWQHVRETVDRIEPAGLARLRAVLAACGDAERLADVATTSVPVWLSVTEDD